MILQTKNRLYFSDFFGFQVTLCRSPLKTCASQMAHFLEHKTMHTAYENMATITMKQAGDVSRVRPACIWRWCRKGVVARNGRRVRLQHVRIGGRVFTTKKWMDDFSELLAVADVESFEQKLNGTGGRVVRPCKSRPDSQRQQAIERAERLLKEAGV